jgi:hypothetical protein
MQCPPATSHRCRACHCELLPPLTASRIVRASGLGAFGGVLAYIHLQTVRGGRVAPRDMRCHYCGTLLPALDLQRPFFVVLGLAALLLLIVVLLIAGLAAFLRTRRFPPPWSVEEQDACFIVCDANRTMGLLRDGVREHPYEGCEK